MSFDCSAIPKQDISQKWSGSGRKVVGKWSEVVGNHSEMVQIIVETHFFFKKYIIELVTAAAHRFWGSQAPLKSSGHLPVAINDLELI